MPEKKQTSEYKEANTIIRLIRSCDYDLIDQAITKLLKLKSDKLYHRLLQNTFLDKNGRLWVNPQFVVAARNQPAIDYAFFQIIGYAPNRILKQYKLNRNSIKAINMHAYYSYGFTTYTLDVFPSGLLNLRMLQHLNLGNCRMQQIPEGLSKLKNLKTFICNSRHIDTIPEGLINLTTIEYVKLSGGSLTKIPVEVKSWKQIKNLDLGRNKISVIENIFDLKSLKILTLSNNRIESIPDQIKKLEFLEVFELENNYCQQEIDIQPGLTYLKNLQKMDFRYSKPFLKPGRKLMYDRNLVISYFKKLRIHFQLPVQDLVKVYEPPKSMAKHKPFFTNKKTHTKRIKPLPVQIQSQINFISSLLEDKSGNSLEAGLTILENVSDMRIFRSSVKSIVYISDDGELISGYRTRNEVTHYLQLIKKFLAKNKTPNDLGILKIKSLVLSHPSKEALDILLNFQSLKKLTLMDETIENDFFDHPVFTNLEYIGLNNCGIKQLKIDNRFKKIIQIKIEKSGIDELEITAKSLNSVLALDVDSKLFEIKNADRITNISIGENYRYKSMISDLRITNCPELYFVKVTSDNSSNMIIDKCPKLRVLHLDETSVIDNLKIDDSINNVEDLSLKSDHTVLPDFTNRCSKCKKLTLENDVIRAKTLDLTCFTNLEELEITGKEIDRLPNSIYSLSNLKTISIGRRNIKLINRIVELKQLKQLRMYIAEIDRRKFYYYLKNINRTTSFY